MPAHLAAEFEITNPAGIAPYWDGRQTVPQRRPRSPERQSGTSG